LPSPDRLGHAGVGETVDDGHPNMSFDDLAFEAPGEQFVAELLELIHPVFGQAASMITTVILPAVPALDVNGHPEDDRCPKEGHRLWVELTYAHISGTNRAACSANQFSEQGRWGWISKKNNRSIRLGRIRPCALKQTGALLPARLVALRGQEVCLRRLGEDRAGEVRFGRFLSNPRVTAKELVGDGA
jgi:hypothetical protein